jgi:hypothetical protein
LRKTTRVPLFALCFSAFLSAVTAATPSATPAAPTPAKPDSLKSAKPAATPAQAVPQVSAAAAPAQPAVPAKADSAQLAMPAAAPAPVSDSGKAAKADTAKADAAAVPAVADTAKTLMAAAADSAKADSVAAAAARDSAELDSAKAKAKKRKRVVRETTVNTIDELKGKYRSPKKALFMSLVVPGLGQAYVGQHWFNYARGATYFLADVAMIIGWHHYVVDKQNAEIDKYQAFADKNWRQSKYEDSIQIAPDKLDVRNPHRTSYCDDIQETNTAAGKDLNQACRNPKDPEYANFANVYDDRSWSVDSISRFRSQFPNTHGFYELIGKEPEFITGWLDADSVFMGDSSFFAMGPDGGALKDVHGLPVIATTLMQQQYVAMRDQANDYARMQAWFLGGMVINHIVSAVDAALTAHYHNKSLYQTETYWYDRLRLDSRLAWDGYAPVPTVTASFTF